MAEHDECIEALRISFTAEHNLDDEGPDRIDQDEYDALMKRVYDVLGSETIDIIATICTSERWSPDDFLCVAQNDDQLEAFLKRIDDIKIGLP